MADAINWELYLTFLNVMREGSLSGAARVTGKTQPTVGRHIAELEAALGTTLFTRSPTGLAPTDVARALRAHAETMESSVASMARTASRQNGAVAGVVRITASDVVAVEVLPPIIRTLRSAHPQLVVECVLTDRVQDLLRREADIAVRMTRPAQDKLIARKIGTIELGLHAHRDYLAARGRPRSTAALHGHTLIGYDVPADYMRRYASTLAPLSRDTFALRSDSNLAQLALIRAGAGLGFCQVPLARRDPALVRVLKTTFALPLETWVTMHEDLRDDRSCRVVFDALADGLTNYIHGPGTNP